MFSATIRVCAAAELGNDTLVAVELNFLRSNAAENYAALQQALVCAERLDEAAALYVRRLSDPNARADALLALQDWAPDPAGLRFRDKMYERLQRIQSRAEVQAALAAVGRSREIPLSLAYWGGKF
jgi:hypothetical protein